MKVAVIGASGWLGGTIAHEAHSRGHEVTAISRSASRVQGIDGATVAVAELDDPDSIVRAVAGADVVVSAVTDPTTDDRSRIPAAAEGESRITSGDFAAAFLDELEQHRFPGQRFTAGS